MKFWAFILVISTVFAVLAMIGGRDPMDYILLMFICLAGADARAVREGRP